MKREFLQTFKIGDQALTKEVIDAIMEENGRDIEAARKPFADYDDLKGQIATLTGQLAGKDAAWQAKLDGMKFDHLLEGRITAARGRNAKAITALLDVDTLKASQKQEADIDAALEALKKDNGFLFDNGSTPPPFANGVGTGAPGGNSDAALRAAFGLPVEK